MGRISSDHDCRRSNNLLGFATFSRKFIDLMETFYKTKKQEK